MTRLPDWDRRLQAVLAAWAPRRHGWGDNCADFAADAVEAVTGRDLRPAFELPVRSARDAAGLFRRVGAKSLQGAVSSQFGEAVDRRRVCRGDLVEAAGSMALGVCVGDRAAFLDDTGLMLLPIDRVARGWNV